MTSCANGQLPGGDFVPVNVADGPASPLRPSKRRSFDWRSTPYAVAPSLPQVAPGLAMTALSLRPVVYPGISFASGRLESDSQRDFTKRPRRAAIAAGPP